MAQTLRLIANPIGFLMQCADRYGDMFTLRPLGPQSPPVVFVSDPASLGEIFGGVSGLLELGRVTHVFRPLVGSQSLIMQVGAQHTRSRALMMPAFGRERLQRQARLITEAATTQAQTWPVGQAVDIREQMSQISLRVILEVVFGLLPGARYDALQVLLGNLLEKITDSLYSVQFFVPALQINAGPWSPWGGFVAQMAQIDALIAAEIADRRAASRIEAAQGEAAQAPPRFDILSMLLEAQDEAGQSMPDTELRDQLITLLLLGHETTASSLTWAFYWVHRHPEILDRLRAEILSLGDEPDPIELAEQPYLTAVCKESLRVQPIALIAQPRLVRSGVTLAGYDFPVGTVLIPCILTAHTRVETWGDPAVFRPDRFLEQKFSSAAYFPFGGGNRSCIGMGLSMLEMKLVLATVLRQAAFTTNLSGDVKPARRGITFVPPDRFRLTPI